MHLCKSLAAHEGKREPHLINIENFTVGSNNNIADETKLAICYGSYGKVPAVVTVILLVRLSHVVI